MHDRAVTGSSDSGSSGNALGVTPALAAHNLSRRYGDFQALAPTDLAVQPGELVVVTGPNGSGKTTLLLCLSGLLPPSTGMVRVSGYDLYDDEPEAKRRLAFVPDVPRFYASLSVWEHIQFIALAHEVTGYEEKAGHLLHELGLWRARHLFPHALSRGMRLKLALLLALVRPCTVLLLDEPTSALDPESMTLLQEKLSALSAGGAAILLTTHDTAFAASVAATKQSRVEDCRLILA